MKKLIPIFLILCLLFGCAPAEPAAYDGPAEALLSLPSYTETAATLPHGTDLTDMACTTQAALYYLASVPEGEGRLLQLYRTDLATGTTAMLRPCPTLQEPETGRAVTAILPGEGDTVWLMETVTRYIFDLPRNFNENTMDKWDYYQYRGNAMTFTHVDAAGKTLQTFTVDGLMSAYSCALWHGGSLFCAADSALLQLAADGTVAQSVKMPGFIYALAVSGGSLAVFCETADGSALYLLQEDLTFGEGRPLPMTVKRPTATEDGICFARQGNLFCWDIHAGEGRKLLDWQFLSRNRSHVPWVQPGGDGTVLALYQEHPGEDAALLTLTPAKQEHSTEPVLILGAVTADENVLELALQFNLRRNGCTVYVADYSEYAALGRSGTDQLRLDLAGGRLPDLLCSMDATQPLTALAPHMLEELTPYLQKDAAIGGQGLMDSVFAALAARDGGLYTVTPSFRLSTTVALSALVSPVPLSVERTALLCAGAEQDGFPPMEPYTTREAALAAHLSRRALSHAGGIDQAALLQGLALARLYPTQKQVNAASKLSPQWARVRRGSQLYLSGSYGSFSDLAHDLSSVGDGAVLAGWPDVPGGHVLEVWEGWAMTTACAEKDLAWLFLRQLLLDETQTSMVLGGFPTNRTAFHRAGRSAMQSGKVAFYPAGEEMVEISDKLTSSQYTAIEAAADSAVTLSAPVEAGLSDAICQAVSDYFADRMTEDDALIAAQNALQLYPTSGQ